MMDKRYDISKAVAGNMSAATMVDAMHKLGASNYKELYEAGDHCQCGNTKLALDTVIGWLDALA